MASRRVKSSNRDTAKDIILGLAPSGQGPRAPKEGVASYQPKQRARSSDSRNNRSYDSSQGSGVRGTVAPVVIKQPTKTIIDRRPDNDAINRLHSQIGELQRQNQQLIQGEQAARRRLEANQHDMNKRMMTAADNGVSTREFDDLRRQMATVDGKLMHVSQDLNGLKNSLDRQINDLIHINNEIKSRPVVDPSKIANSTQQVDNKVRDLHTQIMQLKQQLEKEQNERERNNRQTQETIQKLQDIIKEQDRAKSDILKNLSKKGDMDKEKMSEEAKRLNEKIHLITNEVTKSMNESQLKMRAEMSHKYSALDAAVRNQMDSQSIFEQDMKRRIDGGLKIQSDQIDQLAKTIQADKNKHKERFQKVNEALAALEHHLELGNKKMDKLMNSEIQSRKLHEKGLLSKMQEVEDKLNNYMGGLQKSIADVQQGEKNVKIPQLDVDALRREMEAIAADKTKLSMEGLLKLEEKMSRVQQTLHRDKREVADRVSTMSDSEQVNKLRKQVDKLDDVNAEMEETQERIRDKVEKQIPQDLNELSAKADNIKHQMNARIDKEEEERYLAIKELQEAYAKLASGSRLGSAKGEGGQQTSSVKRDVDECKVAIKKLAESVTTVKNVLDKKITDESRKRDSEIERLETRMNGRTQAQ